MKRNENVETVGSGERGSYEPPALVEYGRLSVRFALKTGIATR